jgi:16S rRNA processing protein RimM
MRKTPASTLEAGRVGRPHGLDGSFYLTGARPGLLAVGSDVMVDGRSLRVLRYAGVDKRPILRLQGVEDRTAAQALRGMALVVDQLQAPALAQDEWWAHELEGCLVVDGSTSIGTVSRLIELPSCEALEVRREQGGQILVPMVKDAIRNVDVAEGRIDVNLSFLGETWT